MTIQNKALKLAHARLRVRDQNGDGKITLKELRAFYTKDEELQTHFTQPDLVAMAEHYFHMLDANDDGFISLDELI